MKNLETVKKLEVFILYIITHAEKYNIPEVKLLNLLQHFKMIPEKGGEIFKRPDLVYQMMTGDCDDWTTLVSFLAHRNNIKYKHVYKLKNDSPIHIYPVLKLSGEWVTIDPWQSRQAFKYRIRSDEKEVDTCLRIGGICQDF